MCCENTKGELDSYEALEAHSQVEGQSCTQTVTLRKTKFCSKRTVFKSLRKHARKV